MTVSITVNAEAWERIFGDKAEDPAPSSRRCPCGSGENTCDDPDCIGKETH